MDLEQGLETVKTGEETAMSVSSAEDSPMETGTPKSADYMSVEEEEKEASDWDRDAPTSPMAEQEKIKSSLENIIYEEEQRRKGTEQVSIFKTELGAMAKELPENINFGARQETFRSKRKSENQNKPRVEVA